MDKDIQAFLDGINSKSEGAWEKLYVDYYPPLCHYAARILNDPQQAEDLVQSSLLRMWQMTLSFADMPGLNVYLYRMVNNNCLKEIRDRDRNDRRLREWAFHDDGDTSESFRAVVIEEAVRKLRGIIDRMPPKRREVMLMSMRQVRNADIAQALDISANTVKKHKKEAYAAIRQAIKSDVFLFSVFFL